MTEFIKEKGYLKAILSEAKDTVVWCETGILSRFFIEFGQKYALKATPFPFIDVGKLNHA